MSSQENELRSGVHHNLTAAARVALFAVAATPLVLVPHFLFPFVTTRNIFFRLAVEFAFAAVLLAGVKRLRDIDVGRDRVLVWFGVYIGALSIAALSGLAPFHSLFGDFERMGGVFAWLHLFLFYCLLRVLMRERDWVLLFRLIVFAADIAVVWGAFEFLPDAVRNPLFQTTLEAGSTVGNPGLLAPYLLLACALAVWDFMHSGERFWKVAAGVSIGILLFGLAGSRNRSSELGLLAGVLTGGIVALCCSRDRKLIAKKLGIGAAWLAGFLALAIVAMTWLAPKVALRLGARWRGFLSSPIDHERTTEWRIALEGFRDRPLLGYGPENHEIIASHHFDPRIYEFLPNAVFDRAHNAWLELLGTSGIVGALAMLGLWLAAAGTIRRGARDGSLSPGESAVLSAALVGYATYLTFWFFDVNSVFIWVVLLAYASYRATGRINVLRPAEQGAHPFAWATVGVTLLAAYFHGVVPLAAARNLATAAEGGPFTQRLMAFERTLNSPAPQRLHTFPLYYSFLRGSAAQVSAQGTNPLVRKEFDLAMQRGLIEAERSIARNPADDRSHVEAARFFSLAGLYYSNPRYVQRAEKELLKAASISPARPDVRVLLSGVYSALRDTLTASAELDSAMAMAPKFSPAFVYASSLQLSVGNVDSSATLLARAMNGAKSPVQRQLLTVLDSLRARREYDRAAALAFYYLQTVWGPEPEWGRPHVLHDADAFATQIAGMLPVLYLNGGHEDRALQTAASLAVVAPYARSAVARFTSELRAGRGSEWQSRSLLDAGLSPPH